MQSIATRALVLRSFRINDRKKIVVLFCEKIGKISTIVYNSTKLTSQKIAQYETANLIEVHLSKYNDSFTLKESNLISCFATIKSEPKKLISLFQLCFALDQMLASEQNEEQLFQKTLLFLSKLSQNSSVNFFSHLHFMFQHLGFEDENLNHDAANLNEKFFLITSRKLPLGF